MRTKIVIMFAALCALVLAYVGNAQAPEGRIITSEIGNVYPAKPMPVLLYDARGREVPLHYTFTIATCNPQEVFAGYEKANALQVEFEKEIQQAKSQVQVAAKQIAIKQKELGDLKKRSDEYEKAFEALAGLKAEYAVFVKIRTAELDAKRNDLLNSGLTDVYAAIEKVAKAKGINLVLSQNTTIEGRGTVLYGDSALDITDAVIEILNGADTKDTN